MGKLKPCPFCGGEAEIVDIDPTDEPKEERGAEVGDLVGIATTRPEYWIWSDHDDLDTSLRERVSVLMRRAEIERRIADEPKEEI